MWHCINLLSGLVTGCASRFRHILAWLTKGPRQHPSSNVENPGEQGDIEDRTFGEIAYYLMLNAVSSCETRPLYWQGVKSACLTMSESLPASSAKRTLPAPVGTSLSCQNVWPGPCVARQKLQDRRT